MEKEKLPSASFKFISGTDYLYVSTYNADKSRENRIRLKEEGKTIQEVSDRGSVYDVRCIGQWNLEDPSDKLVAFLHDKPEEYIKNLDDKFKKRQRDRLIKKLNNICNNDSLQQSE
ncbi:MAG: hypothetical protein ACQEUT_18105 [Bacillota bacterium]